MLNMLKFFILSVFLGVMIVGLTSCDDDGSRGGIGATDAPLPQTGQTTCYNQAGTMINCADTGQDGDIQAGVVPPVPRFTDNGEGQITDNLTGLVWLRDADCFGKRRWVIALVLANSLESGQCGLTDGSIPGQWRLPNRNELRSLFNLQNSNPATDLNAPLSTGNVLYWTSTSYPANAARAWEIPVIDGAIGHFAKTNSRLVTAVRDQF
jgi:hypothetical protein